MLSLKRALECFWAFLIYKFWLLIKKTDNLAALGLQRSVGLAIVPFQQGVNSPVCHHLHLISFIYLHYLPSTLGIWFFNPCVTLLLSKKSRTEYVKNSEESAFLTSQQIRLATVLWMLADQRRIGPETKDFTNISSQTLSIFLYQLPMPKFLQGDIEQNLTYVRILFSWIPEQEKVLMAERSFRILNG